LTGRLRVPKIRNGLNPDEVMPLSDDGEVFSSHDLKSWTRRASSEAKALPNTLEVASEGNETAFYVGLSADDYQEAPIAAANIVKLVPRNFYW
jgi:hypothetical protein